MRIRDADSEVGSPGTTREHQGFEAGTTVAESNRPPTQRNEPPEFHEAWCRREGVVISVA
jgi:hypothetical protein